MARPEGLFTSFLRMNFGYKLHLLKELWKGKKGQADKISTVLHRFQEVRNAVAHPQPKNLKGCVAGLTNSHREIDNSIGDEVNILEAAQGICFFFANRSRCDSVESEI